VRPQMRTCRSAGIVTTRAPPDEPRMLARTSLVHSEPQACVPSDQNPPAHMYIRPASLLLFCARSPCLPLFSKAASPSRSVPRLLPRVQSAVYPYLESHRRHDLGALALLDSPWCRNARVGLASCPAPQTVLLNSIADVNVHGSGNRSLAELLSRPHSRTMCSSPGRSWSHSSCRST